MKNTFIALCFIICTSFHTDEKVYWKGQVVLFTPADRTQWHCARIIEAPTYDSAKSIFDRYLACGVPSRDGTMVKNAQIVRGCDDKPFYWILPFNPKTDILR